MHRIQTVIYTLNNKNIYILKIRKFLKRTILPTTWKIISYLLAQALTQAWDHPQLEWVRTKKTSPIRLKTPATPRVFPPLAA